MDIKDEISTAEDDSGSDIVFEASLPSKYNSAVGTITNEGPFVVLVRSGTPNDDLVQLNVADVNHIIQETPDSHHFNGLEENGNELPTAGVRGVSVRRQDDESFLSLSHEAILMLSSCNGSKSSNRESLPLANDVKIEIGDDGCEPPVKRKRKARKARKGPGRPRKHQLREPTAPNSVKPLVGPKSAKMAAQLNSTQTRKKAPKPAKVEFKEISDEDLDECENSPDEEDRNGWSKQVDDDYQPDGEYLSADEIEAEEEFDEAEEEDEDEEPVRKRSRGGTKKPLKKYTRVPKSDKRPDEEIPKSGDSNYCIIKDLQEKPFRTRPYAEKLKIIRAGRPTPSLEGILIANSLEKGAKKKRAFHNYIYDKFKWMAGSASAIRLYCWPCILFSKDPNSSWCNAGYRDLNHLSRSTDEHKVSKSHIECWIALASFGKWKAKMADRTAIEEHNMAVTKYRELFKLVLELAVYTVRNDQPLMTVFDFGGFVEFMSKFNPALVPYIEGDRKFEFGDILEGFCSLLKDEIKREVSVAKFVSLLIQEHPGMANEHEVMCSLCYVAEYKFVERFVGVYNAPVNRTAVKIAAFVTSVLYEFKCVDKLVGVMMGGSVVKDDELTQCVSLIKKKCPKVVLLSAHWQKLNAIIIQAVSSIDKCKMFFNAIDTLLKFYLENIKVFVDEYNCDLMPETHGVWKHCSSIVKRIQMHRGTLEDGVKDLSTSGLNMMANCLLQHLQSFDFVFMLSLFSDLLDRIATLPADVHGKKDDCEAVFLVVQTAAKSIIQMKEQAYFHQLWNATCASAKQPLDDSFLNEYMGCLFKVVDIAANQLEERFRFMKHYTIAGLLDHKVFSENARSLPEGFHDSCLSEQFNPFLLRNELVVLYSGPQFRGRSVEHILRLIGKYDLSECLSEVHKLCSLVLTLPIFSSEDEKHISVRKRVKSFLSCPNSSKFLHLATVFVEKELLLAMKSRLEFPESVITKYCQVQSDSDFLQFNSLCT